MQLFSEKNLKLAIDKAHSISADGHFNFFNLTFNKVFNNLLKVILSKSERQVTLMASKKVKIAATYFITIILTMVLLGGTAYFIITHYVFAEKDDGSDLDALLKPDTQTVTEGYQPTFENNKTILIILDAEKRESGSCFLLLRFLPTEQGALVMPIQSDCEVNGANGKTTLYELFRTGGTTKAIAAIKEITGLEIDHYMKFDKDSFTNALDIFGGVNYKIPYQLIYDNKETGEMTVIQEGEQFLDATLIRRVLTYPLYKNGESYRATVLAMLTADLLNQNLGTGMSDRLDSCFSTVINSGMETNITSYDYEDQKKALAYVLDADEDTVSIVLPIGGYNEDGRYVMNQDFVRLLPDTLMTVPPAYSTTTTATEAANE